MLLFDSAISDILFCKLSHLNCQNHLRLVFPPFVWQVPDKAIQVNYYFPLNARRIATAGDCARVEIYILASEVLYSLAFL